MGGMGGGVAGIGSIGGAPVGVPGAVAGAQQRALAVDLARQLYSGEELTNMFNSLTGMSSHDLARTIIFMQNELNKGGHTPSSTQFVPGVPHQHAQEIEAHRGEHRGWIQTVLPGPWCCQEQTAPCPPPTEEPPQDRPAHSREHAKERMPLHRTRSF